MHLYRQYKGDLKRYRNCIEPGTKIDATDGAMDDLRRKVNHKLGEYSSMKLEEYEKNYKDFNAFGTLGKYCKNADNGNGIMDSQLISHVTFDYHNLITGDFTKRYDIIFCRNVMIYFDNAAKLKLFEKFYHSLNENGLLIIGFYDAVLPLIDEKKFQILDLDAKIFQKKTPVP
jgi:chemotaxis protein methyltransferase CheR